MKKYKRIVMTDEQKRTVGTVCANCGATEHLEYHHIVPLADGGTTELSNTVCLCRDCHDKADREGLYRKRYEECKIQGRPMEYGDAKSEKVFWMYVNGEVSMYEAKRLLGMPKGVKITDVKAFKLFVEKNGIKKPKNGRTYVPPETMGQHVVEGRAASAKIEDYDDATNRRYHAMAFGLVGLADGPEKEFILGLMGDAIPDGWTAKDAPYDGDADYRTVFKEMCDRLGRSL